MIAAAAAEARRGAGRAAVPAGGAGHPRRRPPGQRAVPVHAAGDDCRRSAHLGAEARRGAERLAGARPMSTPTSRNAACETDLDHRPRRPRRGSALTTAQIDNTLYDAFGQRQVSTIYNALNQYHVVMEVAPQYWQKPGNAEGHLCQHLRRRSAARRPRAAADAGHGDHRQQRSARRRRPRNARPPRATWPPTRSPSAAAAAPRPARRSAPAPETMVPLAGADALRLRAPTPTGRQPPGPCSSPRTISFNLAPGKSLSDATAAIERTHAQIGMPPTIHGAFAGHRRALPAVARQRSPC